MRNGYEVLHFERAGEDAPGRPRPVLGPGPGRPGAGRPLGRPGGLPARLARPQASGSSTRPAASTSPAPRTASRPGWPSTTSSTSSSDYGTTVESEIEVFALIARADEDPRSFSLLVAVLALFESGYLDKGLGAFRADPDHLSHDPRTWASGSATPSPGAARWRGGSTPPTASTSSAVDWFARAARRPRRPADEFGFDGPGAKSLEAKAAGSVGPVPARGHHRRPGRLGPGHGGGRGPGRTTPSACCRLKATRRALMPVPFPTADDRRPRPAAAARVLHVARGVMTAVAPPEGLTRVQALCFRALSDAMTDTRSTSTPSTPIDGRRLRRGPGPAGRAFRVRMVQMMILLALLLRRRAPGGRRPPAGVRRRAERRRRLPGPAGRHPPPGGGRARPGHGRLRAQRLRDDGLRAGGRRRPSTPRPSSGPRRPNDPALAARWAALEQCPEAASAGGCGSSTGPGASRSRARRAAPRRRWPSTTGSTSSPTTARRSSPSSRSSG